MKREKKKAVNSMCTQKDAISILREAYRSCDNLLQHSIVDAYLYGSYARGDFHDESDVDILLTSTLPLEQINRTRRDIASIASQLSLNHDITVSLTIKQLDQFRSHLSISPYYQNVLKEGIRYGS